MTTGTSLLCRIIEGMHKYFEKAWQPDHSLFYIAGFIAADGCLMDPLGSHRNQITIKLSSTDSSILSFIGEQILETHRVIQSQRGIFSYSSLTFTAPRLYAFLLELGVTPRKSRTLEVRLDGLSAQEKLYFIRGVIDGDGHIRTGKTPGHDLIMIASGSEKFAEQMKALCGGRIYNVAGQRKNPQYQLRISGSVAHSFSRLLPVEKYMLDRKTSCILKLREHKTSNIRKPYGDRKAKLIIYS